MEKIIGTVPGKCRKKREKARLTLNNNPEISWHMKKSRRTYNGVHLNKKSNTQDVVEQSLTEKEKEDITKEAAMNIVQEAAMRSVWFMISEKYGKFSLILFTITNIIMLMGRTSKKQIDEVHFCTSSICCPFVLLPALGNIRNTVCSCPDLWLHPPKDNT